jgi:murein DD-endopeptidase MepM/ murein hydrolase activator NlpD
MSRKSRARGRLIPILFFTFAAGVAAGWWFRPLARAPLSNRAADVTLPTGTRGDASRSPTSTDRDPHTTAATAASAPVDTSRAVEDPIAALLARNLRLPIDNADVNAMKGQFGQSRDGGVRGHEAVDILAPRGTPVHAVEDGTVAKLFLSKQGGITIYQFDPSNTFCYYYAHLDRYAEGLHDGQHLSRGEVIGYVGTTGNAPPNTPHLHFAIFRLTPERRWWQGTPLDPFAAFSH